MKLTLAIFSGAIKALHPKLLGDAAGVQSLNQKPGRGDFRPWNDPLAVATVPASRATIYRMGRDTRSDSQYWLTWTGRVHVMRGYSGDDTTERTYFTGSGTPKWVDNTFALAGAPYPTATRELGVPAPASALVAASNADGTSENTESRYYTYTYVNAKGDEGAPAAASLELVCKVDDTAALSSMAAAPGGYNIDRIRIYVTVTGERGDTEFFFLREIAYTLSSSTDDLRARGEVLETDGWLVPPTDASCLTPMWNGMAAIISGNSVRVCPPYALYAWPIAYEFLPPDTKPVGLGRYRQTLLVLTNGNPCSLVGTSPDSLDLVPIPGQACSSEPSIVSFPHGVVYACEDGLVYHGDGGQKLITSGLLSRDDWQAMDPTTMVAGQYEGAYLCFYDDGATRRGFLIDPANPQGIFFLEEGYDALWFDELQDALFVLDGTEVKKWDAGAAAMTATYRSKEWVTALTNFGWMRVTADDYPVTVRIDAGPFTSAELTRLTTAFAGILTASGSSVRYSATVTSREPVRLPGGFEATDWQVQVETANAVQAVVLATSVKETA